MLSARVALHWNRILTSGSGDYCTAGYGGIAAVTQATGIADWDFPAFVDG